MLLHLLAYHGRMLKTPCFWKSAISNQTANQSSSSSSRTALLGQKKKFCCFRYESVHNLAVFDSNINVPAKGGCVRNLEKKFQLLKKELCLLLEQQSIGANPTTYATLLRDCCNLKALSEGRLVHSRMIRDGLEGHRYLANLLISMYLKCGSPMDAVRVFEKMHEKDLASWTGAIAAHFEQGHTEIGFRVLEQMQSEGFRADRVTYLSIINSFPGQAALSDCKHLHEQIIADGFDRDVAVATALVNMFGKCGSLEGAYSLFMGIPEPNLISWNSIIGSYAHHGRGREAFDLFRRMLSAGVKPNAVTLVSLLNACVNTEFLAAGKSIHAFVAESGYQLHVIVQTALLNMYSKCGSLKETFTVFREMSERNVVSWTAMIAACVRHGASKVAIEVYDQMQREQVRPNVVTYANLFNACANSEALAHGKLIHSSIVDSPYESDLVVGTAILTMYGKCGSLMDAHKMFDKMPERNIVCWNAMIAAYTLHGYGREALALFEQMQLEGLHPDKVTLVSVLDACSTLAFLARGRSIHAWAVDVVGSDVVISTAVLNMYGKCGELEDAQGLFDGMPHRDLVSWNALIAAYGQHGKGALARNYFGQMQWEGLNPDQVSLVSILSSCSHAGMLEEGFHYFDAVNLGDGIRPLMDHYACMVDLLGRSGRLNDAYNFVINMPFKPGAVVWMTLLGACRVYKDVELGKWAAEQHLEMDNQSDAPYVVLSNIYAAAGRWEDVFRIKRMMKERCVKRKPGRSWIEVEGKVHEFLVSDRSHLQTKDIYEKLERLRYQITKLGYVPDTKLVLHDVEEEDKEELIWEHSEKLAISFGLMNTACGTPLRVIKNLRVCSDCHTAIKFISKVVGRDIVVRDSNRFHLFQHGMCSCGDYW